MQGSELGRWLLKHAILALAVLVVAKGGIVDGIRCDDGLSLIAVVLVISLLNLLLRPLLLTSAALLAAGLIAPATRWLAGRPRLMPLAIPCVLLAGLFIPLCLWMTNSAVLYLAGNTLNPKGFHVEGFGSAVWGSLWISIVAMLLSGFAKTSAGGGTGGTGNRQSGNKPKDDERVIDV